MLTLAQRGVFYALPVKTAWEALNDLIALGVPKDEFQKAIKEMEEMYLIKLGMDSAGEQTVSLFNPAMADIAYDVCTPEQIASICLALNDRLKPLQDTDFRIPFLMANFYYRLEEDELTMIHFWKKGFKMLLKERDELPSSVFNQMLECVSEEISSYDYDPREVLGSDIAYPGVNEEHVGMNLLLVKFYIGVSVLCPASIIVGNAVKYSQNESVAGFFWSDGPYPYCNYKVYFPKLVAPIKCLFCGE